MMEKAIHVLFLIYNIQGIKDVVKNKRLKAVEYAFEKVAFSTRTTNLIDNTASLLYGYFVCNVYLMIWF